MRSAIESVAKLSHRREVASSSKIEQFFSGFTKSLSVVLRYGAIESGNPNFAGRFS